MPSYIVKLEGGVDGAPDGGPWYMEWSTIVDAPTSDGMPLEEFKRHYRALYGERGAAELPVRLARVERNGTSAAWRAMSVRELIAGNRAGAGESELSYAELVRVYCIGGDHHV